MRQAEGKSGISNLNVKTDKIYVYNVHEPTDSTYPANVIHNVAAQAVIVGDFDSQFTMWDVILTTQLEKLLNIFDI